MDIEWKLLRMTVICMYTNHFNNNLSLQHKNEILNFNCTLKKLPLCGSPPHLPVQYKCLDEALTLIFLSDVLLWLCWRLLLASFQTNSVAELYCNFLCSLQTVLVSQDDLVFTSSVPVFLDRWLCPVAVLVAVFFFGHLVF